MSRLALSLSAALLLGLTGPALAVAAPALPDLPGAASETGVSAADTGRGHRHSHGPDGLGLDPRGAAGPTVAAAQAVDTTLTATWTVDTTRKPVLTDQPDRFGTLSQVHLVYLYGADAKSPRTKFLSMFEADARAAQRFLLERYGRSVRFDETADGRLDITTVKSRYPTAQLGGRGQFGLVDEELTRVFPDRDSPRKKYVAWLDAPSTACGQGEIYGDWHRDVNNWNDLRTTGVVYRPYNANGRDGGWCRGRTLLHELGHNLGALYGKAPNAFDGFHCDDDKNDVMCYPGSVTDGSDTSATSRGEFDHRNDDYWDAGATSGSLNTAHLGHLNWWTVNLSRFVCRPASAGAAPSCADAATHEAHPEELRYHSGAPTDPPPAEQPTG